MAVYRFAFSVNIPLLGCRCLQILQTRFFLRNGLLQSLLLRVIIAREHPELFSSGPNRGMIFGQSTRESDLTGQRPLFLQRSWYII